MRQAYTRKGNLTFGNEIVGACRKNRRAKGTFMPAKSLCQNIYLPRINTDDADTSLLIRVIRENPRLEVLLFLVNSRQRRR